MRGFLVPTTIIAACLSLRAAPLDLDRQGRTPPLEYQEALVYARQLSSVINQVHAYYVRPVPRHRLYHAALTALYENASLPVPDRLAAELEKHITDPRPGADDAPAIVPADDEAAISRIARERQALGDLPGLRGDAGLRISLHSLSQVLDPHSVPVDHKELRRSSGAVMQRGIGIELAPEDIDGPIRIQSVVLGSPAQRAGLRPGDRITQINGHPAQQFVANNLRQLMGTEGVNEMASRPLELTVLPSGKRVPRRVTLSRDDFRPETVVGVRREAGEFWTFLLDRTPPVGYIRITSLENGTAEDLQAALNALQRDQFRGLILDLRWCPGGFLNEAVLVARTFLKEGSVIATVKSRHRDEEQIYKADFPGPYAELPLIVLVNDETMGGAELIAAALQDNQRAVIVGQRTFGKASVQTMLALQLEGTGFKLTTGSFVRPSGKALHRFPDSKADDDWGVRPDRRHEMRLTADLGRQLKEWHLLQCLRPARSNDALPLDDPLRDPQRQLALQVIREMLKPATPAGSPP